MSSLAAVLSQEFKAEDLEIGVVERGNPDFRTLSREEIEALLQRISEKES